MANRQSTQHDHSIEQTIARLACRQKGSERWEHCAAYNRKRSSLQRNDGKRTVYATKNREWIEDYVDRESTVARKQVQDIETAIMPEQEHMRNIEKAQSTTTKPETTFQEMLNGMGDSPSDLANSEDEEDAEAEDDDEEVTELGKLSEDDEPGWVMGTICKTVQRRKESFRQKQMRLDELTQLRSGDAADHFPERDMEYGTTELKVLAVVTPR